MFVPDLLHEFELGVWKAVFTHLIRILYACGGDRIQVLNSRYGPLLRRTTLHLTWLGTAKCRPLEETSFAFFHANVSAMKKLAARDWEDLLQVQHFWLFIFPADAI